MKQFYNIYKTTPEYLQKSPVISAKEPCSMRKETYNMRKESETEGISYIKCMKQIYLRADFLRIQTIQAVYQFRKGISAGPALKYFTWFIGAGGH